MISVDMIKEKAIAVMPWRWGGAGATQDKHQTQQTGSTSRAGEQRDILRRIRQYENPIDFEDDDWA